VIKKYLNWKNLLVVIAVMIALTALYYANQLTKKLAHEERKKVEIVQNSKCNHIVYSHFLV
jgi:NO-binding membrane sensor protein with MHYT domain